MLKSAAKKAAFFLFVLFLAPVLCVRAATEFNFRSGETSGDAPTPAAPASSQSIPANISADSLTVGDNFSVVHLKGNVVIENDEMKLFCDEAEYDKRTQVATCTGRVLIYRDGQFFSGQRTVYNFKDQSGETNDFESLAMPTYFYSDNVRQLSKDVIVMDDARMTSCDHKDPHYWIEADTVFVYPGIKAVARNAWWKVGGVPIFWLYQYTRYFDQDRARFHVIPGRSGKWGEYLLSGYSPKFRPFMGLKIRPTFNLDYRTKRGLAGGVEADITDIATAGAEFDSKIFSYFLNDRDYEPIFSETDDSGRYWFNLAHTQQVLWGSSLLVNLDVESDSDLVYEFFRNEFETENQRSNFVNLSHSFGIFYMSAYTEFQVNDFDTVIERLPRLKLEQSAVPLFGTDIYYTFNVDGAHLRYAYSDAARRAKEAAGEDPDRFEIDRLDTWHELSWARRFWGWLTIEPWMAFEATYFSESWDGQDKTRLVYNPGVTVSTKAYRVFEGAQSDMLDINQLRHVIQPYVTYDYIPTPNIEPGELYQFDSTDAIDHKNRLELGLRNTLQTRRENEYDNFAPATADIVSSHFYTYYYPEHDASGDRLFSNLFLDNDITLFRQLELGLDLSYNPYTRRWVSVNTDALVYRDEVWGLTVGHRYLDGNTNFLTTGLDVVLTDDWSAKYIERFNCEEGYSQEREISLFRDLHCWDMAVTYCFRRNIDRAGDDEHAFYVTFGIKAFPNKGLRGKL